VKLRLPLVVIASLAVVALALPSRGGTAASPTTTSAEQSFGLGMKAFQQGALEQAVARWTDAADEYDRAGNVTGRIAALTHLAEAYSELGQHLQAEKRLEVALELAQKLGDPAREAHVLAALGNAQLAAGALDAAQAPLERSVAIARTVGNPSLAAIALNNLGNLLSARKRFPDAVQTYEESAAFARRAGDRTLAARSLSNAAIAARKNGAPPESERLLDAAREDLRHATPSHDTAFTLVNVGVAYRDLRPWLTASHDELLRRAGQAFQDAGAMADRLGDRRTASYAWGYLGALYEEERRHDEALRLTRKAILAAQQVNAPESLYLWQWQSARLYRNLGANDDAIAAYRRAVSTLQSIRQELLLRYRDPEGSFRDSVGPLYFELVDLLLQRSASVEGQRAEPYLVEARDTVELFKVAELRDYFRDDCVDTSLAKTTKLDVVSRSTAVVYPIILPDRTELLVSLPGGLKRTTVAVSGNTITQEIRELRRKLEKRTTREYLPHAQQLYRWLIAPLEPDLKAAQIDTLIFVPDGPLRTIPIAALHDGEQFVIARYAVGITPSLNLTDPHAIARKQMKVLSVGVTEAVQGFPALPDVAGELDALRALLGSETLVDREFRSATLERKLKDEQFTVLHIASHAEFGTDAVEKSFLLTFDDKLTIDRLDRLVGVFKFRDEPLELLTLSACETAQGDDRAALGLAGVAIKAGARSAVATLWNVNDRASSDLVVEFYRQLQNPAISRAGALQRAQLKMLTDPRYDHPGFWSAFLLINNWL
jgi:CHAT domain-containing protein